MRKHRLLSMMLFSAMAVAGCVTEPEEPSPRVRLGMSDEDLRFYFGEPLRIEAADTGGEVWYYRLLAPSTPHVDGAAWQDSYDGSGGVAVSVTPGQKVRQECPIFLSAEGRVVEPVPEAAIRGK